MQKRGQGGDVWSILPMTWGWKIGEEQGRPGFAKGGK